MTQSLGSWASAAFALMAVIAMLLLLARFARASGLAPATGAGRIAIIESLPLDARRRVVLLRCDGRQVLLVIGGTQDLLVGWLPDTTGTSRSETAR